jgi:hypothetical protein
MLLAAKIDQIGAAGKASPKDPHRQKIRLAAGRPNAGQASSSQPLEMARHPVAAGRLGIGYNNFVKKSLDI